MIPRRDDDTLRIDDSDELVVVENFGGLQDGEFVLGDHALIVLCTEGMAQFEYNGHTIQMRKNDICLFIMLHSVVSNIMLSPDFNCRQLWFTRNSAWNIKMYGKTDIASLVSMCHHPHISLSEADAALLDEYFLLLCHQLRDRQTQLYRDIVRSLVGTVLLKILSLQHDNSLEADKGDDVTTLHGKQLVDRFTQMVERSDGRVRRVDEFARQLNVTPKYLSRLLKDTIDRNPSDIIELFTMKAIERRLRFTDMTMQQIANDLNFANPSFFGKYFKDHAGMTPMAFRMKYQKM